MFNYLSYIIYCFSYLFIQGLILFFNLQYIIRE